MDFIPPNNSEPTQTSEEQPPSQQPLAQMQPPSPPMDDLQDSHAVSLEFPRDSFGAILQKHRVNDAELSLGEAAAKAHVLVGTLRKLETGDFRQIDINPRFCQPLIQQLCEAYLLTEEETANVLNAFEEDWQKYASQTGALYPQDNLIKNLENSSPRSHQSISAILISILSLFLVALIIGGYFYRKYQQGRLAGLEDDFDLPSIIEPQRLPLDVIPVPNS